MSNDLWYIIEANLVIALLFAVFKLIKRYLSFGWQRFSLLSIPLFALLTVWIKHLPASETWSYKIPLVELKAVEISKHSRVTRDFNWSFVEIAYWSGVILLAFWALFSLYKVFSIFLRNKRKKEEGFTVIELPEQEAFSFFRFIQLPAGIPEHDRRIIFQHEKIHAEKGHSADRLYFEVLHSLCWFNPVLPFMKKELVYVHEFEVDKIMYHKHKAGYMEFLLAYSLGTSSTLYLFTNQFLTELTLIKRIKIMKNNSKKIWMTALALPLIAGTLTLVSFTSERPEVNENTSFQKKESQVETQVDKMPEFVGGMDALTKYLISNVRYPEAAAKANITGKVLVSFVVTKSGEITKVTVKKGVDKDLDAEAKRVINGMPSWIPGEKDQKKVDTEMILPISFQL
ncbi:M56 family metallopeptidase [Fluviicola sp.]|uniref:M56 family metallopeptidase n=1 Tax=Fluviicola sp. TaxID=1917219 RepID=UPI00260D233A|nr:M56 family metallopeptidase [Fluviicola sp.]